jgi:hypothetical protein
MVNPLVFVLIAVILAVCGIIGWIVKKVRGK